ncbi:MAG: monooxygenase [Myxococcota bacterium]
MTTRWVAAVVWMAACASGDGADPTGQAPGDDDDTVGSPTVGDDDDDATAGGPTYWRDAEPVLARSCAGCHTAGDIGPFPLDDYASAASWAPAVATAIEAGTMPPWPPSDDCRPLLGDRSLPDADKATLLAWVEAGAPEGDPADAVSHPVEDAFVGDAEIAMVEPYTARPSTDDYRCFVMDWPPATDTFVTAFEVDPGRRELVHHVIMSVVPPSDVADVEAQDAAEPGPGFECYSFPPGSLLGSWVPGVRVVELPEGTGIHVAPGSKVVAQIHYNTTATPDPEPDTTVIRFGLAPTVDIPAQGVALVDFRWLLPGGMEIPAGSTGVQVSGSMSGRLLAATATDLGLGANESFRIHRVGLHMHTLGQSGGVRVHHADGAEECALEVPAWDFHWQGQYALEEPIVVAPNDDVELWCRWDNAGPDAVDVQWGEATSDEMCLSGLYITR